MKTLKNGFTMIELIFVIVILGIMAAVAIPKMQSVKDDAQLANANENFCVNLKPFYYKQVAIKDTLVGLDMTRFSDAIDGTKWTMSQGGDKTSLVIADINKVNANSLKATFSNSSNNVFVYLVDGNSSTPYSCLVSNKDTSTKTAIEARTLIKSGTNIL